MAYQATTRALAQCAVIDLKGRHDDIAPRLQALGVPAAVTGRAVRHGTTELIQAGPAHWLLLAPLDQEDRLLHALQVNGLAADSLVLDVSDLYQFFAIEGADARQLVAVASPLDADPVALPAEGATFTEAFGQRVLLLRRPYGFDLAIERSYAPMLADYFSRINPGGHRG